MLKSNKGSTLPSGKSSVLSALQAGRAMRKGCKSTLLLVTKEKGGHASCKNASAVMHADGINFKLESISPLIQEYIQ